MAISFCDDLDCWQVVPCTTHGKDDDDAGRVLARIVRVLRLDPIANADRVELASVLGWKVIVQKEQNFQVGSLAVYFVIDSLLDSTPTTAFLKNKPLKMRKINHAVSQGLLAPLSWVGPYLEGSGKTIADLKEGDDVTALMKVQKFTSPEERQPNGRNRVRIKMPLPSQIPKICNAQAKSVERKQNASQLSLQSGCREMDLGTFLNLECSTISPAKACDRAWKEPLREIIIDVRAPCEFAEGHIYGAMNVPLFEDEQRADIGTLFKSKGKLPAIELGKSLIQPRLDLLTSLILPFKNSARISVCCARGGMRSRSFANFLAFSGFEVQQIEGGYRDYRLSLASELKQFFESTTCIALSGRTGVGKTTLLQALAQRSPHSSLDLEGLAQHRSSMFGAFKLIPRTQQQFEAELHYEVWLQQRSFCKKPVFIEFEGSKIGNIQLPSSLRQNFVRGPQILCIASMDTRIERLTKEYWFEPSDEAALASMQRVVSHPHLLKKLGFEMINRLQTCLLRHDLHEFVHLLLKNYYDPLYDHSIGEESAYSMILDVEDFSSAVDKLQSFREDHFRKNSKQDQDNAEVPTGK